MVHTQYQNDLIPCADPAITERLLHFSELPNPNSPIVVCGVQVRNEISILSPPQKKISGFFTSDVYAVHLKKIKEKGNFFIVDSTTMSFKREEK